MSIGHIDEGGGGQHTLVDGGTQKLVFVLCPSTTVTGLRHFFVRVHGVSVEANAEAWLGSRERIVVLAGLFL